MSYGIDVWSENVFVSFDEGLDQSSAEILVFQDFGLDFAFGISARLFAFFGRHLGALKLD